ncbi:hypothetical protein EQG63_09335 [Flavobacterium amnicola]|uniref:Uncharacterized protein n=1 Tax=Flavobacterium amnicola TaxID=2506422 RepID=A0A4Q1K3R4_9FLAO|nr:hypothetical protein [Flavobacterium amnicola]RXR17683.1 hypothetical protein EQG63_09335 [Flavobacterium amnicola]
MKFKSFKLFITLCVLIINVNCKNKKSEKKIEQFYFDKVEHYSTDNKSLISLSINKKHYKNLDENEKKYLKILETNLPAKNSDTTFVSELQNLNFKKVTVENSNIKIYREIFASEFCNEMQENACAPIYRDIYVFRNNNKIVGIAKICFKCQIIDFTSEKYNWERYGECESLNKLENIKKASH